MVALIRRPELEAVPAQSRRNEPRKPLAAVQMPFADKARAITRAAEMVAQGRFQLDHAQVVDGDSVGVGEFSRQQIPPRRRAQRRIGEGVGQKYALRRQTIDVRCMDVGVAHATQGLRPVLIGEDQENIRPSLPRSWRSRRIRKAAGRAHQRKTGGSFNEIPSCRQSFLVH